MPFHGGVNFVSVCTAFFFVLRCVDKGNIPHLASSSNLFFKAGGDEGRSIAIGSFIPHGSPRKGAKTALCILGRGGSVGRA